MQPLLSIELGSSRSPTEKPFSELLQSLVPILPRFGPDPFHLTLECRIAPIETGCRLSRRRIPLVGSPQKRARRGPVEARIAPVW